MFFAIDDTDSPRGMCTTYLMTEIIRRTKLKLSGLPRLVRLDPAIPYKTRGNGALSAEFIEGKIMKEKIGAIDGVETYIYDGVEPDEPELEEFLLEASSVVYDLADLEDTNTNPGIVVSMRRPPEDFYWRAVREEVDLNDAIRVLESVGARYLGIKNSRGLIGSAAALSWVPRVQTYELIFYRNTPHPVPADIKMRVATEIDKIPGTFNNVDTANRHPSIFPREKTPVLAGVRSTMQDTLLESALKVFESNRIAFDRYLLYRTNQASDDHIIHNPSDLSEGKSYEIVAVVESFPRVIRGSHYFVSARWMNHLVQLAAFEPTKEFRRIFRELRPGDTGRFYGTFSNNCLAVEKMQLLSVSSIYLRHPPACSSCGSKMKNVGSRIYSCPECGNTSNVPEYARVPRNLKPGYYDVPVAARRHLSRPFSLFLKEAGTSGEESSGFKKEALIH
ncbi:MAG: tRNA(Ile)(2)-agmatinylcytidine synthase [Thermoplasmataceae archaeon]